MITSRLARGLVALILALRVQSQATDSCTEAVTAIPGDTCASLAELAGISVTAFLQSNPSLTSCSSLTPGSRYCLYGVATSPLGSTSTDGTCGGTVGCAGSEFGSCCSTHGFCGDTADHCGEGCQTGLGECGDGNSTSESAVVGVATSTKIVEATVVVTRTVTDTQIARVSTRVLTLTSVFDSTAVVTSTAVVQVTSSGRGRGNGRSSSTTVKVATPTVVVSTLRTTATAAQKPASATSSAAKPAAKPPSPIIPQTPETCAKYDKVGRRDDCASVAKRNGVSLNDLYKLNPALSARTSLLGGLLCTPGLAGLPLLPLPGPLGAKQCQIGCERLGQWERYYVCTSAN